MISPNFYSKADFCNDIEQLQHTAFCLQVVVQNIMKGSGGPSQINFRLRRILAHLKTRLKLPLFIGLRIIFILRINDAKYCSANMANIN